MGAIRDLWDDGDPQAPAGFKAWGEGISDTVDETAPIVVVSENIVGNSHTIPWPAGKTVCELTITGRSADGSAATVGLRVNGDSTTDNYRTGRITWRTDTTGTVQNNQNPSGSTRIRLGVLGEGNGAANHGQITARIFWGNRLTATSHFFYRSGDGNNYVGQAGGSYGPFQPTVTEINLTNVGGSGWEQAFVHAVFS